MWASSFRAGSLVDVFARLSSSLSKKSYEKKDCHITSNGHVVNVPLSALYGNRSSPYHNKRLIGTCMAVGAYQNLTDQNDPGTTPHFNSWLTGTVNRQRMQCVVYSTSFPINTGSDSLIF